MKKTILFLAILFFSLPVFAVEDITPAGDGTVPAASTAQICSIQPAQYGQLMASNVQLAGIVAELRANSVSKADLNQTIADIMDYYEKETISRLMIVLVIFMVLIFAVLALFKIKRFF